MIRGIRGAITVKENTSDMILTATKKLIMKMIVENHIKPDAVAQVIMTVTNDLNAAFPAKALRELENWNYVPVMCMQEIPVPNSLEMCIRVMMTVETELSQDEINHIYLERAVILRPDLANQ
ncbi:chorismate mutase [Metabacillus malikii]|uniref:chorismate mutase n=1 Tax=Metabacillus malikii TaxID=1504265 RepID=A0ABT9Z9Z4_9BACI|nr:chorismate mutase [Metabacillus malikii]MDQ0228754.1 chorismate mutase [Metabacillus malikii]